jgi:gamma-glutamyltranspeptidase/glutathione hydrolase
MVMRGGELYMAYGLMGGSMQPQGHVQFLVNHIEFGMSIQEAIDCPRVRHTEGLEVKLEHGIARSTMEVMERMGHHVSPAGGEDFGGAQAVMVNADTGTICGASDPRKDGCALGF